MLRIPTPTLSCTSPKLTIILIIILTTGVTEPTLWVPPPQKWISCPCIGQERPGKSIQTKSGATKKTCIWWLESKVQTAQTQKHKILIMTVTDKINITQTSGTNFHLESFIEYESLYKGSY
jgi:hypothetical protein